MLNVILQHPVVYETQSVTYHAYNDGKYVTIETRIKWRIQFKICNLASFFSAYSVTPLMYLLIF